MSVHLADTHTRKYGKNRYMVLNYEQLTDEPEGTIKKVADFLDIEHDPVLTQPTMAGFPWAGNSMFGDSFLGISKTAVGTRRKELTKNELTRIETIASSSLRTISHGTYPKRTLRGGGLLGMHLFRAAWRRVTGNR